jgi:5-methylcytosine-specific restriction endonuclease McrA
MAQDPKPRSRWADKGWANRKGISSTEWRKLRKQVMERDLFLCQPCKRKGFITQAKECDHIKPHFEGGTDDLDNLQAICIHCHAIKTAGEAARSRGFTYKPKPTIGLDGWPVD